MSTKSISKRIRITKQGKIVRRAMALGHSRSNKSGNQLLRKKRSRTLADVRPRDIQHYMK